MCTSALAWHFPNEIFAFLLRFAEIMDDIDLNSLFLAIGLLALVVLPQLLFSEPVARHELRAEKIKKDS